MLKITFHGQTRLGPRPQNASISISKFDIKCNKINIKKNYADHRNVEILS